MRPSSRAYKHSKPTVAGSTPAFPSISTKCFTLGWGSLIAQRSIQDCVIARESVSMPVRLAERRLRLSAGCGESVGPPFLFICGACLEPYRGPLPSNQSAWVAIPNNSGRCPWALRHHSFGEWANWIKPLVYGTRVSKLTRCPTLPTLRVWGLREQPTSTAGSNPASPTIYRCSLATSVAAE